MVSLELEHHGARGSRCLEANSPFRAHLPPPAHRRSKKKRDSFRRGPAHRDTFFKGGTWRFRRATSSLSVNKMAPYCVLVSRLQVSAGAVASVVGSGGGWGASVARGAGGGAWGRCVPRSSRVSAFPFLAVGQRVCPSLRSWPWLPRNSEWYSPGSRLASSGLAHVPLEDSCLLWGWRVVWWLPPSRSRWGQGDWGSAVLLAAIPALCVRRDWQAAVLRPFAYDWAHHFFLSLMLVIWLLFPGQFRVLCNNYFLF